MARNALKAHVATGQLNVGITDPTMGYTENHFINQGDWLRIRSVQAYVGAVAVKCDHEGRSVQTIFFERYHA
jgi:hypothetical protein